MEVRRRTLRYNVYYDASIQTRLVVAFVWFPLYGIIHIKAEIIGVVG